MEDALAVGGVQAIGQLHGDVESPFDARKRLTESIAP
jgi:hypothetical protein